MITQCPECDSDFVLEYDAAFLLDYKPQLATIQIVYCTECDWMTITDWDRGDRPPGPELTETLHGDTNQYVYPDDFNEDTTITM